MLSALFLLLIPLSAHAVTDGQIFQDWRAVCVPAGQEQQQSNCHIFQDLLQKESGKRVLHIAIGHLPGKQALAIVITMPLGISLPPGLTIRIDEKDPKQIPLQACFTDGCQAAFELQSDWQNKLMDGKSAEVIFYNLRNEAISVPVSLNGITAAINAIQAGH